MVRQQHDVSIALCAHPQTRKTKEDQLRKKMQETQRSSSAREMMFALEKAKRERLEATMHHFEQHMHQRELTLAEKVQLILYDTIELACNYSKHDSEMQRLPGAVPIVEAALFPPMTTDLIDAVR